MLVRAMVAFGITMGLLPLTERCLRRFRVLDHPSARSFHDRPTLRGGGVAVAVGALVALLVGSSIGGRDALTLACPAVVFALIGLADDVRGVEAHLRLALQAVAGAIVAGVLVSVGPVWPLWAIVLLPLWLVAFVNAFNFMDGINGISSATAVVAGAAWLAIGSYEGVPAVAVGGLVIAAVAMAFAPFNFPVARLFLGDVGSYFIGSWLAVVVVIGLRDGIPPEAMVGPLLLYLADTGSTLAGRVARGELWYEAHCEHAYQRLMRAGWSHAATTAFVAACTVVIAAFGALSLYGSVPLRVVGDTGMVAALGGYLTAPVLVASARLRRTILVP
jgi:UDP-N-acetylmuramyl pentapeptide phosphotransferase/UDP-N-acetylglucosamine-1-phosphate transferase